MRAFRFLAALFLVGLVVGVLRPSSSPPVILAKESDARLVAQRTHDLSSPAEVKGRFFTTKEESLVDVPESMVGSVASLWHPAEVELSVRMFGGSEWARASVIRAIGEWDREEAAFIQEFYPNETFSLQASCAANPTPTCVHGNGTRNFVNGYVLYEDENTLNPVVEVRFSPVCSQQAIAIEHASSELAITGFDGTRFTVSVLSALTAVQNNGTSREVLYRVMLHEFGHVMGLGHIYNGKDIMDGTAYFVNDPAKRSYISTVDLYAIRKLAELGSGMLKPFSFITLPTSIPYLLINVDQSLN